MDLLSITQSNIMATNFNAFVGGYVSDNGNNAKIIFKDLDIYNFGGSFVYFNEEDRELLNIEFTDSEFL